MPTPHLFQARFTVNMVIGMTAMLVVDVISSLQSRNLKINKWLAMECAHDSTRGNGCHGKI